MPYSGTIKINILTSQWKKDTWLTKKNQELTKLRGRGSSTGLVLKFNGLLWRKYKWLKSTSNIIFRAIILQHSVYDIWKDPLSSCFCIRQGLRFLFHRVLKILTVFRMLKISIARCQIAPEIHGFPTMYIMRGGKFVKKGSIRWFCPKNSPQIILCGHKSGSSDFGGVWDLNFFKCCHFWYYPSKVWVISIKMSHGLVH